MLREAVDQGAEEPWCLVSSRADLSAAEIVGYYGKRFTTEENFRDTKDIRFGLGLSATRVGAWSCPVQYEQIGSET